MKAFCIPVSLAEKLKEAARSGEIEIRDLYEKTSEQRREIFSKYTDNETARLINSGFEEAMISAQKTSLKKWAEKTFTGEARRTKVYKDVIDKINELDELGVVDPFSDTFLEDLAATRLGISVSKEEVEKLSEYSKELETLKPASDESKFGISLDYLKKRRELNDYIESLTPSHNLRVATSTIGRGLMLASIKSPLLNIESNTIGGLLEAFTKRLASGQYIGKNNSLANEYIGFATKVYKETGFDITRMMEVQLSPKVLGEDMVTSQGKGTVRKLGRVVEDIVFKKALGLPDVVFSAIQFSDTANLASTMMARKEGLSGAAQVARAKAIMTDSMRLVPETEEGRALRDQSIADAAYATYQNDTALSRIGLSIRSIVNQATGDLRLGDQLMPFVKTPANVISFGLDYSVGGVAKGAVDLVAALKAKKAGDADEFTKLFTKAKRNWIRAGLGLSIAFVLAGAVDDDDFIGAYPTTAKERELLRTQNGLPNSIRIGDKYISLDYFGAIGSPLMGFLYAKKFGKELPGQSSNFLYGQLNMLSNMPGYDELKGLIEGVYDRATKSKNYTSDQELGDIINGLTDFISSRIIPGGVVDLAKITDQYQRQVDYEDPIAKLKAKLPGLNQELPIKTDLFGNKLLNEEGVSQLLFGSRVKTASDNLIIDELKRLQDSGKLPTLTDPRSTSDRFIELGNQLDPLKYDEAYSYYQEQLNKYWTEEIKSNQYSKKSDEDKTDELNKLKTDALERTLKKFGYKKPKD